jgi:dTDP-4-amino-4,6-dideoxygalactose transaminase
LPKLTAYAYLNQAAQSMRACEMDTQLLSLPIGEHLSNDDIDIVINTLSTFQKHSNSP